MTKRYHKQTAEENPQATGRLPIDRPVAAYYRQSTQAQVGNISTLMQTVDLREWLLEQGWKSENIIPIDTDEGVSGTLAIDERRGMFRLLQMVERREIGAVACVNVDRLFRDEYLGQAGTFAKACAENGVVVVTPYQIAYDFSHPLYGEFHVSRFLNDCQAAGKFIRFHVKYKMLGAKNRLIKDGFWTGNGSITPGFMIRRVNGRKKGGLYVPLPEVATVVLEYFKLYVFTYRGNAAATQRHIAENGPYYPDFGTLQAQYGDEYLIQKPARLADDHGKLYPKVAALRGMFSNVIYVGTWAVGGKVIRENNHEGVIPPDLFQAAFNYASSVNPDGSPNENHEDRGKGKSPRRRDSQDSDPGRENRPLLEGFLYAVDPKTGVERRVTTAWDKGPQGGKCYWYVATGRNRYQAYKLWQKQADHIDLAVRRLMLPAMNRLEPQLKLDTPEPDSGAEKRSLEKQRQAATRRMAGYIRDRAETDDPAERQMITEQLENDKKEIGRLDRKLQKLEDVAAQQALRGKLRLNVQDWRLRYWTLTPEQRRACLQTLVKRVIVTRNGNDFEVTVIWIDDQKSSTVLPKHADGWTNDETDKLLRLIDEGADQVTILDTFRSRKWKGIRERYMRIRGGVIPVRGPVREHESWRDYTNRMAASEPTPDEPENDDSLTHKLAYLAGDSEDTPESGIEDDQSIPMELRTSGILMESRSELSG